MTHEVKVFKVSLDDLAKMTKENCPEEFREVLDDIKKSAAEATRDTREGSKEPTREEARKMANELLSEIAEARNEANAQGNKLVVGVLGGLEALINELFEDAPSETASKDRVAVQKCTNSIEESMASFKEYLEAEYAVLARNLGEPNLAPEYLPYYCVYEHITDHLNKAKK